MAIPRDATAHVGGVPFTLLSAMRRRQDHIDLGPSWLQAGLLAGDFDGGSGDAARWRGALHRTPGRIQFRIRNRIDTPIEVAYYEAGGILPYVLRNQLNKRN